MKRLSIGLCLAFLLSLFAPSAHAQARVLFGGTGGDLYSNVFGSIDAKLEVPVKSHLEFDVDGAVSPHISANGYNVSLEKKVGLGSGWAYNYSGTSILWLSKSIGFDGNFGGSAYSVTATSKHEYFAQGGLVYRTLWFGDVPTRFTFNYVQEVANGILPNGDETNHLQGGSVTFDSRFGCASIFCVRFVTNIQGGKVLNQGNPNCDGTFGTTGGPNGGPCPRSAAMGGGASASLYFEFPRRKDASSTVF